MTGWGAAIDSMVSTFAAVAEPAAGAAAGHAVVLAEYRRLGALRDNAARCGVLSPGSRSDAIDGINTHNNHPGRAC